MPHAEIPDGNYMPYGIWPPHALGHVISMWNFSSGCHMRIFRKFQMEIIIIINLDLYSAYQGCKSSTQGMGAAKRAGAAGADKF